jgi:hypothetical protein
MGFKFVSARSALASVVPVANRDGITRRCPSFRVRIPRLQSTTLGFKVPIR